MKCFVYNKNNSKKVATINDVETVKTNKGEITFVTKNNEVFTFSTKEFKTTSYQN